MSAFVLQREVNVAGRGCLEIRDFAFDPNVDKPAFQHLANLEADLGNGIDFSLRFRVSHLGSIV